MSDSGENHTLDPLEQLGWDAHFENAWEGIDDTQGLLPGRIVLEQRGELTVATRDRELIAVVAGSLRHHASGTGELPAMGDWVAVEPPGPGGDRGRIRHVLARKTKISRKAAGERTDEQVVATNVDTMFIVMGLDGDYNLRRLERFLATAWESGAAPVVLLNKADLAEDLDARLAEVEGIVLGSAPVHVIAAKQGTGLDALTGYLEPGKTIALLGSSGVGKSTLINRLAESDVMRTREVRSSDDRGQHTTSHRELVRLESGALLIDNPGIRELQLWDAGSGLGETFDDIEELAESCRFRDCQHDNEPGCAVTAAAADGSLDLARLENWRELQKELAYLERRQDQSAQLAEKRRWKQIHKSLRDNPKR